MAPGITLPMRIKFFGTSETQTLPLVFDNENMASNININVKNAIIFITVSVVILYFTGIPMLNKRATFINMKELLSVSIDVAERGGVRVKVVREGSSLDETSKGKTKEGVNDVLTAGDLQSHLTMMNGFQKAFPGLKVSRLVKLIIVTATCHCRSGVAQA